MNAARFGEHEDTPEQDAARRAVAQREFCRRVIRALDAVTMLPGHPDKHRLRQLKAVDLAAITDDQMAAMNSLAWKYRRQMPPGLAPKLNPDDPIVCQRMKETALGFA